MTNWRLFSNPFNPVEESEEHAKWRRAVKTAEKNLQDLAAGLDDKTYGKLFEKTRRSIDKVLSFDRWIEPEEREIGVRLSRQIQEAVEQGRLVQQEERERELSRLRQEKKEEWFGLTTYEKELRLGKARR